MFLTMHISYIHTHTCIYNGQRTIARCAWAPLQYLSYVVLRMSCFVCCVLYYCMMYIRCTVTRNSQRRRLCFIKVHAAQQGATLQAACFIHTCRCCLSGRCLHSSLGCSRFRCQLHLLRNENRGVHLRGLGVNLPAAWARGGSMRTVVRHVGISGNKTEEEQRTAKTNQLYAPTKNGTQM